MSSARSHWPTRSSSSSDDLGVPLPGGVSTTPIVAAVSIATATGLTMLMLGAAWGTCIEVARNHAGVVGAVMNTSGQVAGLLIPLVVCYSVEWLNNWDFPIYMLAWSARSAGC